MLILRTVRRHWPIAILCTIAVLAIVLPALAAFAQDLPTPAPNNPNNPTLVAWSVLASAVLGAILKALSPGNTTLSAELSPTALHIISVAGSVATTCLLAIVGGTPWVQAIVAGLLPLVTGYVQVGAAKSSWLAILENALLPLTRRAKASKALGMAVPAPPPVKP